MSEPTEKKFNPFEKRLPKPFESLEEINSLTNRIRRKMKKHAIQHGLEQLNELL